MCICKREREGERERERESSVPFYGREESKMMEKLGLGFYGRYEICILFLLLSSSIIV